MFTPLKKVILIFVLTLICLYISLPNEVPFKLNVGPLKIDKKLYRYDLNINYSRLSLTKNFDLVLGLDLAGGSHLTFEADTKSKSGEDKKEALVSLKEVMERRVNLFGVSEPNVQISSFQDKDRIIVELPGVKETEEAIKLIGKTAQLIFAEVSNENEPGFKPTELTGADLKRAKVTFDSQSGKPAVSIEFNDEGAKKFEDLTEKNVGKPLAIFLDQDLVSSPIVQEKIVGGSAQITGDFSVDQAKNLSIQLNAGALPLSVELVEQRTVGATLGEESVVKSINAGIIGLFMVLTFMILAY